MLNIRKTEEKDIPDILRLIKALAIYEKAEDEAIATEKDIRDSLFSKSAVAYGLIAECDKKTVGFAIYFFNYSTWKGKKGLYLEDLFVDPDYRGKGLGLALMKTLAKIAVKENCPRFEWSVINWNEPAIEFYKSLGAKPQDEWTVWRMNHKSIEKFVSK